MFVYVYKFQNDSTQIVVANARTEDVAGSSNTASGQICSEVGDFAPEAENTNVKSPSSSTCNTAKNIDNQGNQISVTGPTRNFNLLYIIQVNLASVVMPSWHIL